MSVVTFKTGLISEMFDWKEGGYIYLPSWVREIGSMLQLMPLLIVPFVGVIQTCRYFLHGPDDLFDVSFQYVIRGGVQYEWQDKTRVLRLVAPLSPKSLHPLSKQFIFYRLLSHFTAAQHCLYQKPPPDISNISKKAGILPDEFLFVLQRASND